jgi:hypothetical protein
MTRREEVKKMIIENNNYILVWENPEGELDAEMAPNCNQSLLEHILENPLRNSSRGAGDTVTVYTLGTIVYKGTPEVRI